MSYLGTFSAVLLALVAFKFIDPWIYMARNKIMGWEEDRPAERG